MAVLIQVFIQIALLSKTLKYLLQKRIVLYLGTCIGVFPQIQIYWLPWVLSFVIILIPKTLFYNEDDHKIIGHQRLSKLRQAIDFVKFSLLGFALIGALDIYRNQIPYIILLLISGLIIQVIFQKLYKEKYHIKNSVPSLQIIIIIIGIFTFLMPFPYWTIIGYFALGIWQNLYFEKNIEGLLKRERIFIVISTTLSLLAHFFIPAITQSFLIGIVAVTMFVITIRTRQQYNWIWRAIVLTSTILWVVIFYFNIRVLHSFHIFYSKNTRNIEQSKNIPTVYLFHSLSDKPVKTNIVDRNILQNKDINHNISFFNPPTLFLLLNIQLSNLWDNKTVYILDAQPWTAYINNPKSLPLSDLFCQNVSDNSILFLGEHKDIYCQNNKALSLPNTLPTLTEDEKKVFYHFIFQLANKKEDQKENSTALALYNEIYSYFPDDTIIIKKISSIYGKLNQIEEQIRYMELYFTKNQQFDIVEHLLLIELYFLKNEFIKGKELCLRGIKGGSNNIVIYSKWLLKFLTQDGSIAEVNDFYNTIKNWTPIEAKDIIEKEKFILAIEDLLSSKKNIAWDDAMKINRNKEIKLVLPY